MRRRRSWLDRTIRRSPSSSLLLIAVSQESSSVSLSATHARRYTLLIGYRHCVLWVVVTLTLTVMV